MEIKHIQNPLNVKIEMKEVYSGIFEYKIPEQYYFDSYGTSYGNSIYGRAVLDNYYVIKQKDETDTDTNSE